MNQQVFVRLLVLSAGNLIFFTVRYVKVAQAPGGGVKGLGYALLTFVSLFLSVLLSGIGAQLLFKGLCRGRPKALPIISVLAAFAPVLTFAVAELFGRTQTH